MHSLSVTAAPSRTARVQAVLMPAALAYALYVLFLLAMPSVPGAYIDDLAAELDPESYLLKVEAEARWAVYFWHQAVDVVSRSQSFHLALALWCVVSAQISVLLLPKRKLPFVAIATVAIAANPVIMDLLKWPGTVLPMTLMLLSSSSALLLVRARFAVWAAVLAAGVLANMISYQLFSVYVLGIALLASLDLAGAMPEIPEKERWRRLAVTSCVAFLAMAAGMLVMYAMNYMAFGRFGVSTEPWRYEGIPEGTSGLALLFWNLVRCAMNLSQVTGHVLPFVVLSLLTLAASNAARGGWRPWPRSAGVTSLTVPAAICLVAAAPFFIPLASGLPLPAERGGMTLWLAAAAIGLAVAARPASRIHERAALGLLMTLGVASMAVGTRGLAEFSRQDAQNRAWAGALVQEVGAALVATEEVPTRLVLAGVPQELVGDAAGQSLWASWLVKQAVHGGAMEVVACTSITQCEAVAGAGITGSESAAGAYPEAGHVVMSGKSILVKIGPPGPD